MKKEIMSMAVTIFLVFVLALFVFKPYVMPVFWGFFFKSPASLQDLKVPFPKGVILSKGEDNISFHLWNNSHVFLFIKKMAPEKLQKENILNFFNKKNFHILSTQDESFKGYKGFSISYVDETWEYNKVLCVIPKGLYIRYTGTKKDYKPFKKIINDIEFL